MRTTPDGAERGLLRRVTSTGAALALGLGLLAPAAAAADPAFPDVPADSPHLAAIDDLADRGVVLGKTDGTFGPADLLTRGQLASVLARALDLDPADDGPFTDVSGVHAGAINALADRDIILGKGDGRFDPNGTITRDQVASMLARFLDLDPVGTDAFSDVPSGNVHRTAINALAAIDVARGSTTGEYGPRRDLRRDQSASFVARALAHAEDTEPELPTPDCPDLDAPVPGTASGPAADGFTPTITVEDTARLEVGETITVTGSGFDPEANVGTRPPLMGQPAGVYVVFGNIADEWRPSEGAPSSARAGGSQRWAIPGDPDTLPFGLGSNPEYVPLTEDGTFSADLTVTLPASTPGGPGGFAVYTFPGSGATNAAHELAIPTTVSGEVVVDDAEVTWGVKASFRDYIAGGIANGAITTSGAVTAAADGAFTWEAEGRQSGIGVFDTTDGVVTFTGHEGLLYLELSDLVIEPAEDGATGRLFADVCSRSLEDEAYLGYPDVHLADLTFDAVVPDGSRASVTASAVLTDEGAPAFAGFYEAGEALDDVTVTFTPPTPPEPAS